MANQVIEAVAETLEEARAQIKWHIRQMPNPWGKAVLTEKVLSDGEPHHVIHFAETAAEWEEET